MFRKLISVLVLTFSFSLAGQAVAQDLSGVEVNDQWDKPMVIDDTVKWLVFSHHKEGGEWVKNTFQQQKITDTSALNMQYMADISAMPGLITRLFAIPKMKDYGFRMGLIKDENLSQDWPRQEEKVSVFWMDKGSVSEAQYFGSEQEFAAWLKSVR